MGLELLVDEDTSSKRLVRMLVDAGHDVVTVLSEGLQGSTDQEVLEQARDLERVVLTQNVGDFRELHDADPEHPGILGIFHERDPSGHMTYADIVRAIGNPESSGIEVASEFHVLNVWR